MKSVAHIISTIFQPLLMPTYSILLLFVYTHFGMMPLDKFWILITPAVLFTFAMPSLLILLLYKMRIISDLSLKIRRERIYPYLITLISYSLAIWVYYRMQMPKWFIMVIASSVAIMIAAIIITLKWKISAHMFGIGGLIGGAMSVSFFVEQTNPYFMFMGLFIIAGLVGTSRLILKRHTLAQVIAGFLLGFLFSFVFVWKGI